ncbi:cold-shock protein [Candidatus Wolfebacteria bacterium]|nr:MAG: cold-shock protein [Candidatus Wolfebacteria bacterium]
METGTIKRLTDKGFGFIEQEGNDKDLFFHASSLVDTEYNDLREGDAVTFDTEETDRGLQAVNVKKA